MTFEKIYGLMVTMKTRYFKSSAKRTDHVAIFKYAFGWYRFISVTIDGEKCNGRTYKNYAYRKSELRGWRASYYTWTEITKEDVFLLNL